MKRLKKFIYAVPIVLIAALLLVIAPKAKASTSSVGSKFNATNYYHCLADGDGGAARSVAYDSALSQQAYLADSIFPGGGKTMLSPSYNYSGSGDKNCQTIFNEVAGSPRWDANYGNTLNNVGYVSTDGGEYEVFEITGNLSRKIIFNGVFCDFLKSRFGESMCTFNLTNNENKTTARIEVDYKKHEAKIGQGNSNSISLNGWTLQYRVPSFGTSALGLETEGISRDISLGNNGDEFKNNIKNELGFQGYTTEWSSPGNSSREWADNLLANMENSTLKTVLRGGFEAWFIINPATAFSGKLETSVDFNATDRIVSSSSGKNFNYANDAAAAARESVSRFTSYKDPASLYLDEDETAELFQFYLKQAISEGNNNAATPFVCNAPEAVTSLTPVKIKQGGTWYNCYANMGSINPASVQVAVQMGDKGSGQMPWIEKQSLSYVIAWLNNHDGKDPEPGEVTDPSVVDPTDPSVTGETDDASEIDCYGARGTLGASWLICPFLTWTANGLNWFYDSVVEDYVKTDISITSNNRVYDAWTVFQNAANIVIVIVIMVVIFSQLTGVGIDNYGIKKVLPRLILCAILINLSYFIMQALVDVSNIVGSSIGGLFQVAGTGGSLESATSLDVPSNILGISIATAAGAGIAAVVANPAVLLTLILVLISGLISVLTMWVILSLRQALVLIVVVISPIAVASYILPNTRSFGKKWGSLVKDLLILYPEAAFLIGVCFFASGLMAEANEAMTFPAIIMRVLPFIALPELFRRSINAIDGLGNRISNYSHNLTRGATGATRGTDWYKNAQERSLERRTRLRAGVNQDGTEATGWRGLLRSRNARNRARYRQQYLKTQSEQEKAELLNSPEYLEAMRQKQELDRRAEQNEIDLMNSPDYRSAVRAKQDTDLEKKQTEAQASAITTGAFKRSDGVDVNTSNLSALARALQFEASQDDDKQDISKIRALYDAILAKGDDGIDALATIWDMGSLQGKGLQRITESIASDGNIKAKARSLHAIANDVMSPSSGVTYKPGQISAARAAGTYASKIKPEMISNMTDNERDSYIQYANSTGDATAMRNIYLASQNINSFKPGEQRAVYDVADRYVQDHMELANTGTYINSNGDEIKLRRNADNVLVYDDGSDVPIDEVEFKNKNFRLKRN